MQIDLTIVGVCIIVGFFATLITGKLPNFAKNDTTLLNKRLKERDVYIDELVKDRDRYKNKLANLIRQVEEEPEIPPIEGDLTNPENLKSIIATVLPSFADYLPKWAQGLARNPTIAGIAIDYFSKHPDQVATLLGKFVKTGGKKTEGQETAQQQPEAIIGAEYH